MMEYKNKRNPILPLRYHVPDGEAHMMPDGKLYIYGSYDALDTTYCSQEYHVVSTEDMEHWTVHDASFRVQDVPWLGDPQVKHYPGIDWEHPTPFLQKMIDAMPEDVKAAAIEARKAEKEKIEKGKSEKQTTDNAAQEVRRELLFAPDCIYRDGRYICWLKLSEGTGYFVILSSQNLLGPYRMEKDHYRPFGASVGDFDLWQDEEGKGFLYFEHDHAGVISTGLTDDYLDVQGEYLDMFTGLNPPYAREACTHFVYKDRHYLLTSGMIGYIPNPSEIAVSDNPLGPYKILGNPHVDDGSSASFNSQISCVFHDPVRPELYLVMADRWLPGYVMTKERYERLERVIVSQSNPDVHPTEEDYLEAKHAPFLGNDDTSIAEYVWLPLKLDGEYPVIEWKDEWEID